MRYAKFSEKSETRLVFARLTSFLHKLLEYTRNTNSEQRNIITSLLFFRKRTTIHNEQHKISKMAMIETQKENEHRDRKDEILSEQFVEEGLQSTEKARFSCWTRLCGCRKRACCCFRSHKPDDKDCEYSAALARKRLFRLAFTAHILFVIGAALQLYGSHLDLHWIKSIQHIPVSVLRAKDDATWMAYQRQQRYQKSSRRDLATTTVQTDNIDTDTTVYDFVGSTSLDSDSGDKNDESTDTSTNEEDTETDDSQTADVDLTLSKSPALGSWSGVPWVALPEDIEDAFQVLGYNEELWLSGGAAFSEQLFWYDLTQNQQEQAVVLGFSEKTWNESRDSNAVATTPQTDLPVTAKPTPVPSTEAPKPAKTASPTKVKPTTAPKYDEFPGALPTPSSFLKRVEYLEQEGLMPMEYIGMPIWKILLAVASLFFLAVGAINWIREEQVFHIWLVQGSVCMIFSALCLPFSESGSILFKTVGYHCYLIEGAYLLRLRKAIRPLDGLQTMSYALWAADFMFGASSIVNIIMSYWQFINADAVYDVNLGYGEVLSAWLWMFASLVYFLSTTVLAKKELHRYIDRNYY